MSKSKNILTIKDWLGSGTGSINIEVADFLIERNRKLIVSRSPDKYSSRLGMMARLNQNSRSLSWGFTEMYLTIETTSDAGGFISRKVYAFISVGVEKTLTLGIYELVTFIFNEKNEFCIGQC